MVYVAGNHEFYGHTLEPIYDQLREASARSQGRFHFLENDRVVMQGVRFLGATLWTDYRLNAGPKKSQQQLMAYAGRCLNDHRLIRLGRKLFEPAHALALHEVSRSWLTSELVKPFPGKTVVVSHHGPHPLSVHPRYADTDLNAAFVSDLSELMPGVDLWLHGHVHDGFDYRAGTCRVVANPAGYVRNRGWVEHARDFVFENETFNPSLLLEV